MFEWGTDVLEVNERLEGRDGPAVSGYRFPEEIDDHDEYGLNGRAGGRRDMGLEVGDVLLVDYMGKRDGCLDLSAKTRLVRVAGRQTVRSPDSMNCLEQGIAGAPIATPRVVHELQTAHTRNSLPTGHEIHLGVVGASSAGTNTARLDNEE